MPTVAGLGQVAASDGGYFQIFEEKDELFKCFLGFSRMDRLLGVVVARLLH